jgi:carboxymethylenebutenolidase
MSMTIEISSVTLRAVDGHELSAYRAVPPNPVGSVVLLHEVFGIDQHVRDLAGSYAEEGYFVIAPALFDRVERGVDLAHNDAAIIRGDELWRAIGWRGALLDAQAAINAAHEAGSVGAIGYSWGGSLAFLAAARLIGLGCAVGYYPAQTMPFAQEEVHVPVMLHFGESDSRIPPEDIEAIGEANPEIEIHVFPADHGFNSNYRKEWHAESAMRGHALTLQFLRLHLSQPD